MAERGTMLLEAAFARGRGSRHRKRREMSAVCRAARHVSYIGLRSVRTMPTRVACPDQWLCSGKAPRGACFLTHLANRFFGVSCAAST